MNFPLDIDTALLLLAPFEGKGVDVFEMTKYGGRLTCPPYPEKHVFRFGSLLRDECDWGHRAAEPLAFGGQTAKKTVILASGSPNRETLTPWHLVSYPPHERRNALAPIPRGWEPGKAKEGEIVLVRNPWIPGGWEKKKGPQYPCLIKT